MFDARSAKLLSAGEHLTFPAQPGLRLESTKSSKSWIYRYKSPLDGRMRQIKIGEWPELSFNRAAVEWEGLRDRRNRGEDPAAAARATRVAARAEVAKQEQVAQEQLYTVAVACNDYWEGHVKRRRAMKGVTEIRRLFDKELGPLGDRPAHELTRAEAFGLIHG